MERKFGKVTLGGLFASAMKLALQVQLGNLDIPQSHADVFVPQQLHQGGQTDAPADPFGGVGVAPIPGPE
jgi:hypothetical protein